MRMCRSVLLPYSSRIRFCPARPMVSWWVRNTHFEYFFVCVVLFKCIHVWILGGRSSKTGCLASRRMDSKFSIRLSPLDVFVVFEKISQFLAHLNKICLQSFFFSFYLTVKLRCLLFLSRNHLCASSILFEKNALECVHNFCWNISLPFSSLCAYDCEHELKHMCLDFLKSLSFALVESIVLVFVTFVVFSLNIFYNTGAVNGFRQVSVKSKRGPKGLLSAIHSGAKLWARYFWMP